MSIDLAVRLTRSVPLASLLDGTEKALQEILELPRGPSVHAEDYLRREPLKGSAVLESQSGSIKVAMKSYEDDPVFLFVSERGGDPITSEGRGTFAVVEVHGGSVGLVLAAAVAVALARECKSEIEDNRPYFSSDFEQSSDKFLMAIKGINVNENLRLAVAELRRSIAKG